MPSRSYLLGAIPALIVLTATAASAALPASFTDCMPATEAEAREAFRPMAGSPSPELVRSNGQSVLRFPCKLDKVAERASWDRRVNLDLSQAAGIELKMFCPNFDPIQYFSVHFEGQSGWYTATFFPEKAGAWNTIRLPKKDFQSEGEPGGWETLRTWRISAWKNETEPTEFLLKDLKATGELGVDSFILVLRGSSGERPVRSDTAERLTDYLAEANLGSVVMRDSEVTAADLKKAKVVVLSFDPALSQQAIERIQEYLQEGGKLIAFYHLPDSLRASLNLGEGKAIEAPAEGAFAKIRFHPGALPGAPEELVQDSGWIYAIRPVQGRSKVLAEWLDAQRQPTGHPAVIATTNCILMTHELLPGNRADRAQLMLAMAGALAPELWHQPVAASIDQIGRIGSFDHFEQFAAGLKERSAGKLLARKALDEATRCRNEAIRFSKVNEFARALEASRHAADQARVAYCSVQDSQTNEFRAFWCHSAFGVKGMTWDEAAAKLAANGFNAVIPNMLWGGAAFYPTELLPQGKGMEGKGDQIRECLEACRKHGLAMHVWKVNWYMGSPAPKEFVDRMRSEGRLQQRLGGKEKDWFCPTHPANRQIEIASMVELARKYPIDGLHFDYIRYPDSAHCFCSRCRAKFQEATGIKVTDWTNLLQGPDRDRWHQWRRDNITTVVKAISQQARAARPGIKISAAVFPEWVTDRDSVAQDWSLWCKEGYVDFVCPMDYSVSDRRFENLLKRQKAWANGVPYYPGIGLSTAGTRFGADLVIEQILLTRKHQTGGFVIFNYGTREAEEILPLLGMGVTAPQRNKQHP